MTYLIDFYVFKLGKYGLLHDTDILFLIIIQLDKSQKNEWPGDFAIWVIIFEDGTEIDLLINPHTHHLPNLVLLRTIPVLMRK